MILLPQQRSCQALIESERQMQFSHCIHHVCYLYLSHNSRNTIWSGCISGITNTHASCSLLQVDTLKTFLNELDICQLKSCVLTTLDNSKSEWKWTGNCHHSLKLNPFVNIEGGRAQILCFQLSNSTQVFTNSFVVHYGCLNILLSFAIIHWY